MMKRRAPRACLQCRQRKIKCDFSTAGIPCGSCTRLSTECSVSHARKSRKLSSQDEPGLPFDRIHTFEVQPMQATGHDEGSDMSSSMEHGNGVATATLDMTAESTNLPTMEALTSSSHLSSSSPSFVISVPEPQLPPYITPLRKTLEPEVLYLLQRREALTVPHGAFRASLLRAYVCFVHPYLPLLDLEEFLASVDNEDGSRTVSLPLFQAVMFAASTFVDIEVLEKEGYKSHEEIRRKFFNKVRTLYDVDLETDSLSLVQILVFMTLWYDKTEDPKHRSHWMRNALSFAADVGLIHHSELAILPLPQQRLRRRIWWCCLMRDQLISFSERQPSSIQWDETTFPTLLADDLDSGALSKALAKYQVLDHDRESKILMEFCFQKIRLSVLIGRILRTQYELISHRRMSSSRSKLFLLPKASGSASAEFVSRDQELREWGDDICSALHHAVERVPQQNSTLVTVHSAVIEMLYFNVLGMVHRPQVLNSHPHDSAARALQDFSHQALHKAATRISEIADYLSGVDLLRFLPPIGVTALLFAGMQHIKDSRSATLSVRDTANQGLERAVQAMSRLKEIYPQAHHAVSVLDMVRNQNLHTEELGEGPAIGQKPVLSVFRDELSHYQVGTGHADDRDAQANMDSSSAPEQSLASTGLAMITLSSREGIDYSRRNEEDFESFLRLDEVSDIFLSGGFGVADFEQVDWNEIFQERNWNI